MRSLFWKIFIWFWLAIGIVISASAIAFLTTDAEPLEARWREVSRHLLAAHAYVAGATYVRNGQRDLNEYLENLEQNSHVKAYLFDQQLRELSGRSAPLGAIELAKSALDTASTQKGILEGKDYIAWRVRERDGRDYVFLSELPDGMPPIFRVRFDKRIHIIRLLTLIFSGGLVCWALARYLSSPIRKLRDASRELASGNLKARVGAQSRHDEIALLGRDFDLMAERIEGLVTGQQRLLSDVSHELRSPLARLAVALELARNNASPETSIALDRIQKESERLNDLISQLLVISKLDSGNVKFGKENIDLAPILSQVIEDARFEAQASGKTVAVNEIQAFESEGNRELWRQAFENVIRNAVRYAKSRVEVGFTGGRLIVRDDGPGVPETHLKDIFQPFYRIGDARDRDSGGVGLGLAIVDRAVRLQGGTVTARNHESGGLEIVISVN